MQKTSHFSPTCSVTSSVAVCDDICDALCDLVPFEQLKNVKNTDGGVLLLIKLQALAL